MFGIGKSSKGSTSSGPTFLDIRVKSTYKNLILVKGSQYESPSVILQGHLVFSLPDTMTAKKISLKLVGKYKLDFLEVLAHSRSTVSSPVKQEAVIFEIDWDNLLVSSEGVTIVSTDTKVSTNGIEPRTRHGISGSLIAPKKPSTTKKMHRPNAPSSLTLPVNGITGTPFENVTTPSGVSFNLPGGNYDLPFKCIIPGDIPETVEGLVAGSVLYKFEASIDRGSFKSPIQKFKYFRIFRTLSSDSLQLSETMQIGKTWPGKVQYEVSIPARAVPIGEKTPLNILLVPLIKGMKLGPIKAQIIQYYAFKGTTGDVYDDQQQILDLTMTQMENHILDDKLAIESFIDIPSNLKKVTQDCDLKEDLIKVRHKLKVQINIILPNGHVSELRANLPISFYVSPNADITGRTIVLDKHGKIHFRKEEEPLFERNKHLAGQSREQQFKLAQEEDFAPPNYEAHIYDRLYGSVDNSNNNSTSNSNNNSNLNSGAVSPVLTPGPASPLPILQNQTQQQQAISSSSNHEDISYFGLPTRPARPTTDTASPVSPLLEASIHNEQHGSLTPVVNIGSLGGGVGGSIDDELSKSLEALKFSHISDLPTYQDAIDADDEEAEEFAPNYEGSDVDDVDLIKENNTTSNSQEILAGSNSFGGLGTKSNSSGIKITNGNGSSGALGRGHSRSINALGSAVHSGQGSLSSSAEPSTNPSPARASPLSSRPSPVGKIEIPKDDMFKSTSSLAHSGGSGSSNPSTVPSRPSSFRTSSLSNLLSKHGSSSNLNTIKNSSGSGTNSPSVGKSPSTSSSNLSKLAYKKILKKEKK